MEKTDTARYVELIREFSTVMLITREGNDALRARPMQIAEVEDDGTAWFLTSMDSAKTHEISEDTHVHLAGQLDGKIYLSVNGIAMLSNDREEIARLWKEPYRVWFPGGADDPEIVLVSVAPTDAEYWDERGVQGAKFLLQAATAYVRGTTPDIDEPEQHGHLRP